MPAPDLPMEISIHPPRVGWDFRRGSTPAAACISIHPPRVGWDRCCSKRTSAHQSFQSTHPVWGGTVIPIYSGLIQRISIHPPRVGWDVGNIAHKKCKVISIHPPRVGWDHDHAVPICHRVIFQSTHPVWGGTISLHQEAPEVDVFQSTHPVWGGTGISASGSMSVLNFNPPTPCGVGRGDCRVCLRLQRFQSTHPVWGGTGAGQAGGCREIISIHPPRVGWDVWLYGSANIVVKFQSTHPVWGGTNTHSQL